MFVYRDNSIKLDSMPKAVAANGSGLVAVACINHVSTSVSNAVFKTETYMIQFKSFINFLY